MNELPDGIRHKASEIARVHVSAGGPDLQVERSHATRAEEDHRPAGIMARPVGRDDDIRLQPLAVPARVYMLESMGFETGIDIEALIDLRGEAEAWLPGERFSGSIARAGLPKTFSIRPGGRRPESHTHEQGSL